MQHTNQLVITSPSGPYRWSLSHTMITAPSGPYRLSLSRTMIITPLGPYRPLFCTVSTAPSGPYSFPLYTSKVYAGMKHKTNDLNMTCEKYMNVDKKCNMI